MYAYIKWFRRVGQGWKISVCQEVVATEAVRCCLIFVDPQHVTCFILLFRCLEFWGGFLDLLNCPHRWRMFLEPQYKTVTSESRVVNVSRMNILCHSDGVKESSLQGCFAVYIYRWLPSFRRRAMLPSSRPHIVKLEYADTTCLRNVDMS